MKVIEDKAVAFYNGTMSDADKKQQMDLKINSIEDKIRDQFDCSDVERDLIDYALQVSIPLAVKSKEYQRIFDAMPQDDKMLKDYAHVYINHFATSFNRNGKRFVVEILHSNSVIGMYFKVIDEKDFTNEIVQRKDDTMLSIMARLSSEKITEELFAQKDIRGFEKDFFYIFKPNEKRLWHKAIAYLDVEEFADAMLRVGGDDE